MLIRRLRNTDIPRIARLFHDTVHRVCAAHYSPAHLRAWSPRPASEGAWRRRLAGRHVLVAEHEGTVVGLAALRDGRRLELLYVHPGFQRRGVGAGLLARVEAEARRRSRSRLEADVSLTARTLFSAAGYRVACRRTRWLRRRSFVQYRMTRGPARRRLRLSRPDRRVPPRPPGARPRPDGAGGG